jgi:hypothetical protein
MPMWGPAAASERWSNSTAEPPGTPEPPAQAPSRTSSSATTSMPSRPTPTVQRSGTTCAELRTVPPSTPGGCRSKGAERAETGARARLPRAVREQRHLRRLLGGPDTIGRSAGTTALWRRSVHRGDAAQDERESPASAGLSREPCMVLGRVSARPSTPLPSFQGAGAELIGAGRSIDEISAAAQVRYEVIVEIVRPRN